MPISKKGSRVSGTKTKSAAKTRPRKKPESAAAKLDEEISSESEIEDDDEIPRKRKVEEDSDEEMEAETAQEKRVRLAREYIGKMEAEERDRRDDELQHKEAIVHRLRDEQLDLAGKLKKPLADKFSVDGEVGEVVLRCREQRTPINCVVLSHDNRFIFSGAKDGSIVKYDVEARKKVGFIKRCREVDDQNPTGHSKAVLAFAISDDFKYFASACAQGLILVWNPDSLNRIGKLSGHRGAVTGLAIQKGPAPHLYSCSADKTIKVWSLPEMAYIETTFGHQDSIMGIDCLRRERAVTCGGRDSSVRIWKIPEESHLVFNAPEGNSVDCVRLIDEQHFVSGDDQGVLAYWHALKKKPICSVQEAHSVDSNGNAFWITSVAAVHNSDVVASGSWDSHVRVWRVDEDKRRLEVLMKIPVVGVVNSLQFSSDGKFLVAAVSREMRLGRWSTIREARNSVRVFRLPFESSS